jgi:AraC family transcriptional regulator
MQNYIESNLDKKISFADLSKVCFYSPWYAHRLFLEVTKLTPSEYIRRLKLTKSALDLRDYKKKVLDVANTYGYDSVDGYQRAFFKEFGINPYEYSKKPIPIKLFTPYKYYDEMEKKHMSDVQNVFISVVEKKERLVLIKRGIKAHGYLEYCEEVGCDVWGILQSIKSIEEEPISLWLPKRFVKPNTSTYVQGVVIPNDFKDVPEGFDLIKLPPATYLRFQGEPFEEVNYAEAIDTLWKAIDKFKPETIGYVWDDENPRIQLEPIGTRGYIELKAIKKL